MAQSNKRTMFVVSGVVHIVRRRGTILIDEADLQLLHGRALLIDKCGYARVSATAGIDKTSSSVGLHRLIVNAPEGMLVDHINRNSLDNRRLNLRLCTMSQNKANSEGRSCRTVPYKGLRFDKRRKTNKWLARIGVNGKIRNLGSFPTAELAAIAYNVAAVEEFGGFACLNVILPSTSQLQLAM